jgi:hypothetical protein
VNLKFCMHGIASHKSVSLIFSDMRTSDVIMYVLLFFFLYLEYSLKIKNLTKLIFITYQFSVFAEKKC